MKRDTIISNRFPEITEMVKFRNLVKNAAIGNWADNGQNQIAFCRGDLGFIAINGEISLNFKANLVVCVPPGEYCDIITGGKRLGECVGRSITVGEDTKAQIEISYEQKIPVLAFHLDSKV